MCGRYVQTKRESESAQERDTAIGKSAVAFQLLSIAALAAVLLVALPAGMAIKSSALIKILFLARMPLLLALATWFLKTRGLNWGDLGLRRPRWLLFAASIPLGLVAAGMMGSLVHVLLAACGFREAPYTVFRPLHGNLAEYLYFGILVSWGSAAFCEELIFRGFILNSFERLVGRGSHQPSVWTAMILQSLLFGLAHFYLGIAGVVIAATTGFVLGLVWWFSARNLWAGIVVHGLLDCGAMTAIYLGTVRS